MSTVRSLTSNEDILKAINIYAQKRLNKESNIINKTAEVIKKLSDDINTALLAAKYLSNSVPLAICLLSGDKHRSDILEGLVSKEEAVQRALGKDTYSKNMAVLTKLSLAFGANPASTECYLPMLFGGVPSFHFAVASKNYNMAKTLYNSNVNYEIPDINGTYPIHYAFKEENKEYRLENSEKEQIYDLFYNVSSELTKELLVNKTKDFNVVDQFGRTAMHYLVQNNIKENTKWIDKLKEKGAKLDIKDDLGHTPLHLASKSGNISMIQKLIKNGADEKALDNGNRTPLSYLSIDNQKQIDKYIIESKMQKSHSKNQICMSR